MSSIPYPLDPMGSTNRGSYFELVVKPGILGDSLTYGFTPYWNAGGYCKVVDWGDGSNEDAVTSGALITHTYTASGTYTIRIKADCYRVQFGVSPYNTLLYDANGDWDKLGNITSGINMFIGCTNAQLSFTSLPEGLTNADHMFYSCTNAQLPLTSLPEGLTNAFAMFQLCYNAQLPLTSLPEGITNANGMFGWCRNAQLPFTSLPDGLTNGSEMFKGCTNATLPLTSLPAGLTNGGGMFYNCRNATLPLTSLPAGLTNGGDMFYYCPKAQLDLQELPESLSGNINGMFYHCIKAKLNFTKLPDNITNAGSTFRDCYLAELQITALPESLVTMNAIFEHCRKARINLTKLPRTVRGSLAVAFSNALLAEINLDDLTANAPEGGWTEVTSIEAMFYNAGSGNSPGTVTGSRSAFLAKFPNATNTTNAFYGTNTTE